MTEQDFKDQTIKEFEKTRDKIYKIVKEQEEKYKQYEMYRTVVTDLTIDKVYNPYSASVNSLNKVAIELNSFLYYLEKVI